MVRRHWAQHGLDAFASAYALEWLTRVQFTLRIVRMQPLINLWSQPTQSEWADAAARARSSGVRIHDLITASPLDNDFGFPSGQLRQIISNAATALDSYRPDARGQLRAREAICGYHGNSITPDQIILTPGTSLAYLYAFRILAGQGDEILCPSPTYPLFDDIAAMAGVRVRRYHLHPPQADSSHWAMDADELAFQVTPRTRAIVLVSPHNPTGTIATASELRAVCKIAREHKLAIVFDEVFREFTHAADQQVQRPSEFGAPLTLTLNGFSKMLSLPGLKAGWIAVEGEPKKCSDFKNVCEYLSDTLLPVSEVTQAAIAPLLQHVPDVCPRFREALTSRMAQFVHEWRIASFNVVQPEAGPYLCVPLPENWRGRDQTLAVRLASEGILLHAGSDYGLRDPHVVTTCIGRPPWPLQHVAAHL